MKKKKFSKKDINTIVIKKENKFFKFNKKSVILIIIVLGIISIMVGSVLDLWRGSDNSIKYKDYKFVKDENSDSGWNTYINENYYSFDYLPQEIENLTNTNYDFNINNFYILYDPSDNETGNLVYGIKSLFNDFNKIAYIACIKEKNCGDLPVYTCKEVSGIYLISSDKNKMYNSDKCLVIDGDYNFYLKSINYLRYKMLGVL